MCLNCVLIRSVLYKFGVTLLIVMSLLSHSLQHDDKHDTNTYVCEEIFGQNNASLTPFLTHADLDIDFKSCYQCRTHVRSRKTSNYF